MRRWCEAKCLVEAKAGKKPAMLGDYNQWLYKGSELSVMQMKHVEAMAAVGNTAAHNKPGLKLDEVSWLLREVREFLGKNPIT
ncbi:hypothetical protein ETAA1_45070 [Urbifossiella limnaea]|uniref:DUF4145 domain-containing protein n=1 Tax=Urbifossiella limnaea TaxID=2528023 RepID=A0A517XYE2_9BACT|nr:hypothetical protein ETAA1_45070 [Urbifossiella limnaea]